MKYPPSKGPLFNSCKFVLSWFHNLTNMDCMFLHTNFFFFQWVSNGFLESPNSILSLLCMCSIFGWFVDMNNQQRWQSVYSHLSATILAAYHGEIVFFMLNKRSVELQYIYYVLQASPKFCVLFKYVYTHYSLSCLSSLSLTHCHNFCLFCILQFLPKERGR